MNTLSAFITTVDNSSHLCALGVSFSNDFFELILVEITSLQYGDAVTLVFKETEVILQKFSQQASSANTQKGIVAAIESGIILTSVTLTYHDATIVSLITTNAYKRLDLAIGEEIVWIIQPSEISLLRGHDGI